MPKHNHCSYCGTQFTSDKWPRLCGACQNTTWSNPTPVAICLVPLVDGRVVVIRRGIQPALGELALPSGFIETGESWRQAACRELEEETGILVPNPEEVEHLQTVSSLQSNTLLVFGVTPPIIELPDFTANGEVSELIALRVMDVNQLCWASHREAVVKFLERS